jgi:hypothetical protein
MEAVTRKDNSEIAIRIPAACRAGESCEAVSGFPFAVPGAGTFMVGISGISDSGANVTSHRTVSGIVPFPVETESCRVIIAAATPCSILPFLREGSLREGSLREGFLREGFLREAFLREASVIFVLIICRWKFLADHFREAGGWRRICPGERHRCAMVRNRSGYPAERSVLCSFLG